MLRASPGPLGSMHQHPDHDSDHAQGSHDGEGDKATLERIHLRRPVPGRTAPARGLRALRPLSSGYARCSPASLRNSLDQKSFLDGRTLACLVTTLGVPAFERADYGNTNAAGGYTPLPRRCVFESPPALSQSAEIVRRANSCWTVSPLAGMHSPPPMHPLRWSPAQSFEPT